MPSQCATRASSIGSMGAPLHISEKFSAWMKCSLRMDGFQGQNTDWKGGTATPTVRYREIDYVLNTPGYFEGLEAALSYCPRWLLRRCMLEIAQDANLQDRQCP